MSGSFSRSSISVSLDDVSTNIMKTRFALGFLLVLYWLPVTVLDLPCPSEQHKWTWFLGNQTFYMLYDANMTLENARCLCKSVNESRLAIFDDDVSLDDVTGHLQKYYSQDTFWVDAERRADNGDFTWANNCTLSVNATFEPADGDSAVKLVFHQGSWQFNGTGPTFLYRPLCQSGKPPPNFLPTPPALEWVRLGTIGHMFGFSNETLGLEDAKAACSNQAGKVHLASLDALFSEVSHYILNNHHDRAFWLDAVNVDDTGYLPSFEWASGRSIDSNYFAPPASVAILTVNGTVKLIQSHETDKHYFICEGSPALESSVSPPILFPSVNMSWVAYPQRKFGFSEDLKTFPEAREACAAQTGNIRLAVLDTYSTEVMQWILGNHQDRAYYVDATRPEGSGVPFLWGDGKAINNILWGSEEPGSDAMVAHLKPRGGSFPTIALVGTSTYNQPLRYICEEVHEVTLEWRLLGSPQKLFGFSRTRSLGLEWAREACLRQLGDVRLASLDTHFDDVSQVVSDVYRYQFWVDAELRSGDDTFTWSNGISIVPSMWLQEEPHENDIVARLHYTNRSIVLAGRPITNGGYFFLCEGKPASPVIRTQFPPPCKVEQVTTTEAFTTRATDSTTSSTTSSSEDPTTAFQGPTTRVQDTSTLSDVTTPLHKKKPSGGVEPNSSSCVSAWPTFNVSSEELVKLIQLMQQELLLDKSNLSATKRKLRTAKDERPSAHAIGSFGVVILILLCAIIVIPDTASVFYALARQMGINKTGDVKVSELKNKDNKNGGTI